MSNPPASLSRPRSILPSTLTSSSSSKDKEKDNKSSKPSEKDKKDPTPTPSSKDKDKEKDQKYDPDGSSSSSLSLPSLSLSSLYQRIGPLNIYKSLHQSIGKIITSMTSPKSLLLDMETSGIISLIMTQSEILRSNFLLSEMIDIIALRTDLHSQKWDFLTAVCILSPSKTTLHSLSILLSTPRYHKYYIYFTNIADIQFMDQLAELDKYHLIQEVNEVYADYYAVSPSFYHFQNSRETAVRRIMASAKHYIPSTSPLSPTPSTSSISPSTIKQHDINRSIMDKDVKSLLSLLLSLQRKPDIRYASSSDHARVLATRLSDEINMGEKSLFDSLPHHDPTLLIIFDRRDDPVTPLMTQWTYVAMIHELIGIYNNRIEVKKGEGKKKGQEGNDDGEEKKGDAKYSAADDMDQLILSPVQDSFFRTNQFSLFGAMGTKVKSLVHEYQSKTKTDIKMESIEDIQSVIEKFPQFRQLSGTVSKHMTLMTELAKRVKNKHLMDVSALEQEIVMANDNVEIKEEIFIKMTQILKRGDIEWEDKLRLVMIYSLRYETFTNFSIDKERLLASLEAQCLDDRHRQRLSTLDKLLEYGGFMERRSDLFIYNKTAASLLKNFVKIVKSEISGVENIFTQHKPLAVEQMNKLINGELKIIDFPYVDGSTQMGKIKYKQIIMFMVGGITYEEYTQIETLGQGQEMKDGVSGNNGNGTGNPSSSFSSTLSSTSNKVSSKLALPTPFNRNDYKILCGGSALINCEAFLQEIHPIDTDLTGGKMKKYRAKDGELEELNKVGEGKSNNAQRTATPSPLSSSSSSSSLTNSSSSSSLKTSGSSSTTSSGSSLTSGGKKVTGKVTGDDFV